MRNILSIIAALSFAGLAIFAEVAAGGPGSGPTSPAINTSLPWAVYSPSPCPAASVLSVAVQAPYMYATCSDGKLYQRAR